MLAPQEDLQHSEALQQRADKIKQTHFFTPTVQPKVEIVKPTEFAENIEPQIPLQQQRETSVHKNSMRNKKNVESKTEIKKVTTKGLEQSSTNDSPWIPLQQQQLGFQNEAIGDLRKKHFEEIFKKNSEANSKEKVPNTWPSQQQQQPEVRKRPIGQFKTKSFPHFKPLEQTNSKDNVNTYQQNSWTPLPEQQLQQQQQMRKRGGHLSNQENVQSQNEKHFTDSLTPENSAEEITFSNGKNIEDESSFEPGKDLELESPLTKPFQRSPVKGRGASSYEKMRRHVDRPLPVRVSSLEPSLPDQQQQQQQQQQTEQKRRATIQQLRTRPSTRVKVTEETNEPIAMNEQQSKEKEYLGQTRKRSFTQNQLSEIMGPILPIPEALIDNNQSVETEEPIADEEILTTLRDENFVTNAPIEQLNLVEYNFSSIPEVNFGTTTASTPTTTSTPDSVLTTSSIDLEPVPPTPEEQIQIQLVEKNQMKNLEITIPLSRFKLFNGEQFLQKFDTKAYQNTLDLVTSNEPIQQNIIPRTFKTPFVNLRSRPIQQNTFTKAFETTSANLTSQTIQQNTVETLSESTDSPNQEIIVENLSDTTILQKLEPETPETPSVKISKPVEQNLAPRTKNIASLKIEKTVDQNLESENVSFAHTTQSSQHEDVVKIVDKYPITKRERPNWWKKQPILQIPSAKPIQENFVTPLSKPALEDGKELEEVEEKKPNNDSTQIAEEVLVKVETVTEGNDDVAATLDDKDQNIFVKIEAKPELKKVENILPGFRKMVNKETFKKDEEVEEDEKIEISTSEQTEVKSSTEKDEKENVEKERFKNVENEGSSEKVENVEKFKNEEKFEKIEKVENEKVENEDNDDRTFHVEDVDVFNDSTVATEKQDVVEFPKRLSPKRTFGRGRDKSFERHFGSKARESVQDNISSFFKKLPSPFAPKNKRPSSFRPKAQQQQQQQQQQIGKRRLKFGERIE